MPILESANQMMEGTPYYLPTEDCTHRGRHMFLKELIQTPTTFMEVRRDGADTGAITELIEKEFWRTVSEMPHCDFISHMRVYSSGCWSAALRLQILHTQDERPVNERYNQDPDHWYEINLTNQSLFADLRLDGIDQLVPGRLFTTRMPRDISIKDSAGDNCTLQYKNFLNKCRRNNLKAVLVLTEVEEFQKYSGMEGLLDFYRNECKLTVYNTAIPDYNIPTRGDIIRIILDIVYHLSQGDNCLVHCAGGTGRTGMVVAAIVKNLGVYDPVARIRRVKSTYVETIEQEKFLRNIPIALDSRIVSKVPRLAQAIAAQHVIQLFHTRGRDLSSDLKSTCSISVTELGQEQEEVLRDGFRETFDLLDTDKSGDISREEVTAWLKLFGADIDIKEITEVLLSSGYLDRETFSELLCSTAASSRRSYHI